MCLKTFADRKSIEQHESYHKRVHLLIEQGDLEVRSLIDFASSFPLPFPSTCCVLAQCENVTFSHCIPFQVIDPEILLPETVEVEEEAIDAV